MVCYDEPVAVNHGLSCCVKGFESWWAMLSHWLSIMVWYAGPLVLNHACYAEPNSCESCCVILRRLCLNYGVLCRAIGYTWYEPVVVNSGVLCWTSGYESWCVMLTKWSGIMVCNAAQVDVSHGVLCWDSDCGSFWVMLSKWLWIMLCNAEPVVVNYCVLCWASGCYSWCVIWSQWLWIMVWYAVPVGLNHDV